MQHTIKLSYSLLQDAFESPSRFKKRQEANPERTGSWEAIKYFATDASFSSGSANIKNCQKLWECIRGKIMLYLFCLFYSTSKCLPLLSFGEKILFWRIWCTVLDLNNHCCIYSETFFFYPGRNLQIGFPHPQPSS